MAKSFPSLFLCFPNNKISEAYHDKIGTLNKLLLQLVLGDNYHKCFCYEVLRRYSMKLLKKCHLL